MGDSNPQPPPTDPQAQPPKSRLSRAQIIGLVLGIVSVAGIILAGGYAALVLPASHARWVELKSSGKNIYFAAFMDELERPSAPRPSLPQGPYLLPPPRPSPPTRITIGFPTSKKYRTASEYFRDLMGHVVSADAEYVSGPGLQRAATAADFGPANVAWCVVADCDEYSDAGVPFLISANCTARRLSDLRGPIRSTLDRDHPMGGRIVAIAYHGGTAETIKVQGQDWEDVLRVSLPDAPILHP